MRDEDKKRALVSRLLQRHVIQTLLGVSWDEIEIKRTKGGKPFVAQHDGRFPNFNYNVSHEGDLVGIVSDPICVVGFDISAHEALRRTTPRSLPELRKIFRKQFCENEWTTMELAGPRGPGAAESVFRLHWSLKEAIVKARGDGIVFDLARIALSFPRGTGTTPVESALAIDGQPQPRWHLHSEMCGEHWLSVARCSPDAIIDAYGEFTATMRQPHLDDAAWAAATAAPPPPFRFVTVHDLLPADTKAALEG